MIHPWTLSLSPDTECFVAQADRDSVLLVTVIECAARVQEVSSFVLGNSRMTKQAFLHV